MNVAKRIRLGITLPNLIAKAQELKADNKEVTPESLLSAMLDDPQVSGALKGDLDGLDWEALLDFVIKFLPLILKIVALI
jgi:hypothetical protein